MTEMIETTKANITCWLIALAFALVISFCGFLIPLTSHLSLWGLMWVLAGVQWLVFKLMVFVSAGGFKRLRPAFFLWIGMETDPFLRHRKYQTDRSSHPLTGNDLFPSFASILFGCLLIFFVVPRLNSPVAAGALGMLAILCLLHFGAFHLLARGFNRLGFSVTPIMIEPWRAKDLSDFWGRRWNRAFSDWAGEFVFRPLAKKLGVVKGTLTGFLVSGLAHECTISLPADGGYGLPTLYFLFQGIALLLLRRFKPSAATGPVLTFLCVLLPAPILFHVPFLERVIFPMIQALL